MAYRDDTVTIHLYGKSLSIPRFKIQRMYYVFILFTTVGTLSCFRFNAKHDTLQVLLGFSGTLGHILLTGAQTEGR